MRSKQKLQLLLDALENNDVSLHFSEKENRVANKDVNRTLNRIAQILRNTKHEAEQQEKYYELILKNVDTGIAVINERGAVFQKNEKVLQLLGLEVFTHIRQLDRVEPGLAARLETAQSGDHLQVSFQTERGSVYLSVRVSSIRLRNQPLRIFAFNDINRELDEKELDSWIRLIRVLTHEIMNAVTPITSLSETLLTMDKPIDEDISQGLRTIGMTGRGLLSFVETYRRLTRLPTPEPTLFYLRPFLERMVSLAQSQQSASHITVKMTIRPDDLILYADENLIAQVVMNILRNAIQAIGREGHVWIEAFLNAQEETVILIGNDGEPIPPDVREQIFVPFFTTKPEGTGIGLSLSRQIMRLSGGQITLIPSVDGRTVFRLCFP
jgi:nitrogen fixation/metabolism regulation signal transduction histidine kinase